MISQTQLAQLIKFYGGNRLLTLLIPLFYNVVQNLEIKDRQWSRLFDVNP